MVNIEEDYDHRREIRVVSKPHAVISLTTPCRGNRIRSVHPLCLRQSRPHAV